MVSAKWGTDALQDLKKLDVTIAKRVVEKVTWLEQNFDDVMLGRLHYGLRDLYKLRVGDYRAFYTIGENSITIQAVRHRREAYK